MDNLKMRCTFKSGLTVSVKQMNENFNEQVFIYKDKIIKIETSILGKYSLKLKNRRLQ